MIPEYPATLPGVSGFQFSPAPQEVASDIERSARATHRYSETQGAIANVTWKFSGDQYQEFMDWWRTQLLDGHKWFTLNLPSAAGISPTVVRFLNHRETQVDGYKFWIVTATIEIRERKIRPDIIEDYLTSTIYPIYVFDELEPTLTVRRSQLSPPIEIAEGISAPLTILNSQLLAKLKTGYGQDELEHTVTVLDSQLKTVLKSTDVLEELEPVLTVMDSTLDAILVVNEIPPEGIAPTLTVLSGTLT